MTREEYVKFCQTKKNNSDKTFKSTELSVTDPTFAQTGRQILMNPLPITPRVQYTDGVPLDKENPHSFREFDKMYPDTFAAMVEAKEQVKTTKESVKKAHEDYQKSQQQPQNINPEN